MDSNLKDLVQDCNVNFLLGSGLSCPYLGVLGDIEKLLTAIDAAKQPPDQKQYLKISLYKKYFDEVMSKNIGILNNDVPSLGVLKDYQNFLSVLNVILLKRKSTILGKEINLFTTNIDIFVEKALEESGYEFNDGFNGRFDPSFSLNNFKKSLFKKSLHFDNISELPVFNLVKLHGSLTWESRNDQTIGFAQRLEKIVNLKNIAIAGDVCNIVAGADIGTLVAASVGKAPTALMNNFMSEYEGMMVINPTKEKFKNTTLDQTYYELLRLYSNELERENTVLFVMGFSFSDEHLLDITIRAANSNPTLLVRIYAHSENARRDIAGRFPEGKIKNKNIEVVGPTQTKKGVDDFYYDLATITARELSPILEEDEE